MASLTETAQLSRNLFKFAVLLIVIVIVGFYSVRFVMRTFFGEKPVVTVPTQRLGNTLRAPTFPQSPFASPQELSLDTLTGNFPEVSNIATVHALLRSKTTFGGKEQAVRKARNLEFTAQPKQTDTDVLEFTDEQNRQRVLTINLTSGHFVLKYNYNADNAVFNTNLAAFDESTVTTQAQGFLGSVVGVPPELGNGIKSVEYFEYNQNQLTPVGTEEEADAARVNFFREPVDNLPVVFASPSQSHTYVLLGRTTDTKKRILEAHYTFLPISNPEPLQDDKRDPNPTYYIKTPQQAYEELQQGGGFIAQSEGSDAVAITDISLAYYESENATLLYPIFVFVGDGFTAYVSALFDQYTTKAPTEAVQGISTQNALPPTPVPTLPPKTDYRSPERPRKFSDLLVR